jgi:hypothetical protein
VSARDGPIGRGGAVGQGGVGVRGYGAGFGAVEGGDYEEEEPGVEGQWPWF